MLVPTSRAESRKTSLKMSLIEDAAEHNTLQIHTEQKGNRNNNDDYTPTPTPHATATENIRFECTLGTARYIECIAPNQKGNFIISMCIDELNGWILAGHCSGTLNAWKIPQKQEQQEQQQQQHNKVFECRNLIQCSDDGIRHIHTFANNIVCMVGYRRICSFTDYDASTSVKKKLGINDIFSYSPFTSPHMFYSTQYDNMLHIFCRSFSCALKIDLKTQRKEVLKLNDCNRISLKTHVLNVNKNFVICKTSATKYNSYVEAHNLHKNKKKTADTNRAHKQSNSYSNRIMQWMNQVNPARPRNSNGSGHNTLAKISVRSLENFNLIHNEDYFVPLSINSWGFKMDNVSMTMAFVTSSNVICVVEITPDLNIMQYGVDYDKKQQQKQKEKHKLNVENISKVDLKQQQSHSLADALTLSPGRSYDGSIDTLSGNVNEHHMIDVLQNDDNEQIERVKPSIPKHNTAKQLYTLRGHRGHIVAIEYIDAIVLSIATDKKLCVWNGKTGENIATISNIPGTFVPGYPYIIKKSHNAPNKVFYTADDGIFMAVF